MKKRLFFIIMMISVTASALACILATLTYYNFYVINAENQLKTIVEISASPENWENENKINSSVNKILNSVDYSMRFTIIDINGKVVYDNWANNEDMDNHLDRFEVKEALEKGYGEDTRYSNTIKTDMYYYAVRLTDNEVLRVSRGIHSINSVFAEIIPMLVLLFFVLLIIVYIVTSSFTKKILKPVNDMIKSLDDMMEGKEKLNIKIYDEFEHLSFKIREQRIKISEYINELKYERDTIGIITDNMKEGFILINRDRNILSINTSGKRMIGNDKFDLRNNRNIIELTRNVVILERIDIAIKENKHIVYDIDVNRNHYRYYFSPVKERQSSTVAGLLILIEDVTIQKNAEIMRSEFSANVSHELKTPLTTMIGFAEMIKEGLITDLDRIQKYCGMINKEGLRLISLIEDIMRLSKIEERGNPEDDSFINLKEIANEVVSLLQSKADNLNVTLNLQAENISMKANKNYLSELLYNLIDNGIKYNKSSGFVNINISKSDKFININFKDTGVGIDIEHQDRIFERFYRADKSRSKETGGTGLGLSIVKHIVELYDGEIELKSEILKGTEISIIFPLIK